MRIRMIIILGIILSAQKISGQDIDELLKEADQNSPNYATATFKATRIINGHSIERMQTKQLDVRIEHRFGTFNQGAHYLWGLDQANMHLSLEYGINNWLMVGLGRGTYEKAYDGFLKFSLLRQSSGSKSMPVSLSLLAATSANTLYATEMGLPANATVPFWSRYSYVYQVLVARKFSERFSLEINPTLVHRNMVDTEMDPNDVLALGFGGRIKLSKRISLNGEWYHVFPPIRDYRSQKTYDAIAIGFDIETGGHVFQIMFTNSEPMTEKGFVTETTGMWGRNDIHLGFNISRVFNLKK